MAPVRSSQPPRDWRRGSDTLESARTQRWVGRAVTSLLLLILVAVLGYLVWPRRSQVHFVALPVVDYDPFVVPPIAFSKEDVEAFASVASGGAFHNLRELQTSESMPLLRSRLGGILNKPRLGRRGDGLILYISGHGVADGGVPYLLCSDYLRPGAAAVDGVAGRYRLADVLRQIADCEAAWKLVLLDAGQSAIDPQCGLPANEFACLLEKVVVEIDDPTLWVLTAHGPLQMSHVSYPARRSMFGYYVTEGLRGGADLNGDRMVSLAELHHFVREGVAAWVQWDVGTPAAQVPRLVSAGGGSRPERIELVAVGRRYGVDGDSADSEAMSYPEHNGDTVAGDDSRETAIPKEVRAATAELPAAAQWQIRDRFRELTPPRAWAPVDYAPHLWNLFEYILMEFDGRSRCGDAYPRSPWDMVAPPHLPPFSHPDGLMDDDKVGFAAGAGFERFKRLIQQKNDLFSRLPGYVRYRAHAISRTGRGRGPAHDELAQAMEALQDLVEAVEHFEQETIVDFSDASTMQQIDDLLDRAKRLVDRERGFRDRLNEEGRHLASRPSDEGSAARILALLQTPLLDTDVRATLVAALGSLDARPPGTSQLPAGFVENPDGLLNAFAARQWRLLAEQAELEYRLVQLAGLGHDLQLPEDLAGNDAERQWAEFRRFAGQLRSFYAGLPEEIGERLTSGEMPARRSAGRLIRLLGAGEAGRIPGDVRPATLAFPDDPPPKPRIELAVDPAGDFKLALGQPTAWNIRVQVHGFTAGRGEYRLDYDSEAVELRRRDNDDRIEPNTPVAFNLGSGHAQLAFHATARKAVDPEEAGSHTGISVHVQAGAPETVEEKRRVAMKLPPPDRIDLEVRRVDHEGTTLVESSNESRTLRLRPFPNRLTRFQCSLVNRSHREREVEVRLVSVPRQPAGRELTGSLVLDDSGDLLAGVTTVAGPVTVQLPKDKEPVRLDFRPQEEPAGAVGDGRGGGAENASGPSEPESPDVTGGLMCVVRLPDVGRSEIHVLQFAPVAPVEYVQPRVDYVESEGQVEVQVAARASEPLPPMLPESPIRVRWLQDRPADAPQGKYEAELVQSQSVGDLRARVPRDPDREVFLPLEVDGYPRAFVYRVRCDRTREGILPLINLQEVRIDSPGKDAVFAVPLKEPLQLRFSVDAPQDAFLVPGDRIEVRILEEHVQRDASLEQARDFFSARQQRVELRHAGSALEVFTKVSDFEVPLDLSSLRGRVRLAVRLVLGGSVVAEREVTVTLDGASPVVRTVVAPSSIVQGEPVEVRVEADDLGGIDRIEVGFEGEQPGDFAPAPKPVRMTPGTGDKAAGQWSAQMPTAEIPIGEHRLLICAVDVAGNPPTVEKRRLSVRPQKLGPSVTPPEPLKTGTIQGQVSLRGGGTVRNIRVNVVELSRREVSNGPFTFKDVPHGTYTIEAEAFAIGRRVRGRATVTLSPERDPATVRVELE